MRHCLGIFAFLVLTKIICANNVIDVDDILSEDFMPGSLFMFENPQSHVKNTSVDDEKSKTDGSLDKAMKTMYFHRSMMNQYMCRSFVAEQIISDMTLSRIRRMGTESITKPSKVKLSVTNDLLEDEGSSSYKDWLSKSTTLEDIYRHYDKPQKKEDIVEVEDEKEEETNEEYDTQVTGYGVQQNKGNTIKLGHRHQGGGYYPNYPYSSNVGYQSGNVYGYPNSGYEDYYHTSGSPGNYHSSGSSGHGGHSGYGEGNGIHEQHDHIIHHDHPPKYVSNHGQNHSDKEHDLSDLFEIALTALAFLSFGMFVIHVIMCISMTGNTTTTTATAMMMPMSMSPTATGPTSTGTGGGMTGTGTGGGSTGTGDGGDNTGTGGGTTGTGDGSGTTGTGDGGGTTGTGDGGGTTGTGDGGGTTGTGDGGGTTGTGDGGGTTGTGDGGGTTGTGDGGGATGTGDGGGTTGTGDGGGTTGTGDGGGTTGTGDGGGTTGTGDGGGTTGTGDGGGTTGTGDGGGTTGTGDGGGATGTGDGGGTTGTGEGGGTTGTGTGGGGTGTGATGGDGGTGTGDGGTGTGDGADTFKFRLRREIPTITNPNNYALNELARRILTSIEAALVANNDNGECLRRALCEHNKYSRTLNDSNKLWIPVWSLGMSWLSGRLTKNVRPATSMLDSLKASILGLGQANCEIIYQQCDLRKERKRRRRRRRKRNI